MISLMPWLLLISMSMTYLNAGFFPFNLFKKNTQASGLSAYEEKQQTRETLKKIIDEALSGDKTLEQQLARTGLAPDLKQVLLETQRAKQRLVELVKKHAELLDQYFAQPTFDADRVAQKELYHFDDMVLVAKKVQATQEELAAAQADKKRIELEQTQLDAQLARMDQEEKELARVTVKHPTLHTQLLQYNRELVRAKKTAIAHELSYLDTRIFIAQRQRELLSKDLTRIERKLLVTDDDIKRFQVRVDEAKRAHALQHERFTAELTSLTKVREELQRDIDQLRTTIKTPIKSILQQSDWQLNTLDAHDYVRMYELAVLDAHVQYVDAARDSISVHHALADAQLAAKELELEGLKTWLALSQRRLAHASKAREQYIALFDGKKKDIERHLGEYHNKQAALKILIAQQVRTLESINQQLERIAQQKELFIKTHGEQAYHAVLSFLHQARHHLDQHRALNEQIIKEYGPLTTVLTDMRAQVDALINKLTELAGLLQRDSSAITWQGIKSAAIDVAFLWDEVSSSLQLSTVRETIDWINRVFTDLMTLFNLLLVLVIALTSYFASMVILALVQQLLVRRRHTRGSTLIGDLLATMITFVHDRLIGFICWSSLLYVVHYDVLDINIRAKIIFYVMIMVYVCAMIHALFVYYGVHNSSVVQQPFVRRLLSVIRILAYTTVIVYFCSEIAIIATYGHSEIPHLLWACYSLIIRALFVWLIMTKRVVLELIPSRGLIWSTIRERVDRYYHIFLIVAIALVVLSDPFVGYGRLVSKVIQALVLTGVLGILFIFVQNVMKRYSSHLFFAELGDGVKERFKYGKTWYALFTVLGFGVLIVGALVVLARIWGYQITLAAIEKFFDAELVRVQAEVPGQFISITVQSLLVVTAFIFGGFFISSLFNRYVLQRIYTLLQVDAGVQNTVSRISGYVLVIIIFVVGLQRVGLGALVPNITVVMIGVAWALRGPADDFVAYFMILVERSVKIGDYICLDSAGGEISGVVRKITPRSIVLRKKNSYTIVVPNSTVMRSRILNWNASRSYCAFDDLYIPVDYNADLQQVRDIIMRVLHENPLILKNPVPIVRVEEFAFNGCDFLVRGFISIAQVSNQRDIRSDIRVAIIQEFKKHNIKLSTPIQAITVQSVRDITSQ